MAEYVPPWLQPVKRLTGELFIDEVRHPEVLMTDLFPPKSAVGVARAMRQRESWTKPWWLGLHEFTTIRGEQHRGSPTGLTGGYVYADAVHGEIPWR